MAALWNRAGHYIFALWFLSFVPSFFPRLISAVGDWMSTILPHMMQALVWILNACLKYAACSSLEMQDPKMMQKLAIWAPSHNFVGLYLRNWGMYRQWETRRPASADRTARRQFQATGQPVSRTQASDTMTPRLPRYEVKCVQRRCFQCGSAPLCSDIKGTELPPATIFIPLERMHVALQLCHWQFLYNETLQQTFVFHHHLFASRTDTNMQ